MGQETQSDPFAAGAPSMPNNDEDDISFVVALLSSFGERGNEAAAESAKTVMELSVIVQRMVFARNHSPSDSDSGRYPSRPVSSIAVGGQFVVADFQGSYPSGLGPLEAAGSPEGSNTGSPKKLDPGASGVDEVCAWLQRGHFDR